jgi:hypothetical protein
LLETGIDTLYYLAYEDNKIIVKEHLNILEDVFWAEIKNW